MNCQQYSQLLSEYMDGTLKPRAEAEAQNHVRSCSACREELEALRKTVGLLGRFEPRRLSRDFDTRLFQRLELEKNRRTAPAFPRSYGLLPGRGLWLFRPRALAAAAALVAAGVASWQMYPVGAPPRVDTAYLAACVQAHANAQLASRTTSTHFVPDADLADEETD